ncbi:MAG: hypothetical protein LAO08_14240 [Acidobacteriia bacterium]|nr:hypothetical protein [Terriglobia bacterium]
MRDARIQVTVSERRRDHSGLMWCQVVVVAAMVFFNVGRSFAQELASSDVYVAPQRFYAQKLVEDVRAKHPEVIYLNLRTIPPDRTESFKVASSPPSRGGKSDQADLDAEHGKSLVEQIKEAPQEFRVLLPLRDVSGKIIGNIAMRMKLAQGKTTSDAMKLAERVDRELQSGIPSKAKLFEPV